MSFSVNAQKSLKDQLRLQQAHVMVSFVESVKPAYKKGQTYSDFEKTILGSWNSVPEGKAMLVKAFDFISNGTSNDQILNEYSGAEIAKAHAYFNKLKKVNPNADGAELFGGTATSVNKFSECSKAKAGCKWYQFNCFVQQMILN